MIISAIVAKAANGVIGKDNGMPWHMPADLKYFRKKTMHHHILMGRKVFDSIGKPLKGRINIVVTTNPNFKPGNYMIVHSIDEGIQMAKEDGENELFIIGGAQIYEQTLHLCQRVYMTEIKKEIDGDTYFPPLDESQWRVQDRQDFEADRHNPYPYSFTEYIRIR